MRVLVHLLEVIGKETMVESYNLILSYQLAMRAKKLPSLDEFLGLASSKGNEEPNSFDDTTDKFLEMEALKRLEERKKQHGK